VGNRYPEHGPEVTEDYMRSVPTFDYQTKYAFGSLVCAGYSSLPHYMIFRCDKSPACTEYPSPVSQEWSPAGWYGWEW
jgi:hypothetical protein